ncbi:hypothetical protein PWR63_05645 [Paraburkholderia sp. A2WS-5]|uniref:hypothetical protein n=1 Tax=unclassified Paraburkholderia TaxID=2615204 RepID=UPI003B826F31
MDLHFAVAMVRTMRRGAFSTVLCIALFAGSTGASEPSQRPPGPVMMVHFDYWPRDLPRIRVLEHRLESAIRRAHAGELGETELHLDGNDGYIYMYGADPDRLYVVAGPILKSSRLMADAEVTKWYGARTETFTIHRGSVR